LYRLATIIEEGNRMPQHKSAIKQAKINVRRQEQNRAAKSTIRRALRRYRELAPEARASAYPEIQALLDRATCKRIIPARRASRLKSRLAP